MQFFPFVQDETTRGAAQQGIARIIEANATGSSQEGSPLQAILALFSRLSGSNDVSSWLWLINDRRSRCNEPGLASVWPLCLALPPASPERPLVYLTQAATPSALSVITRQTGQRGIFFNDLESSPSSWPKGAHPLLSAWLATHDYCWPFDPSDAAEATSILLGALQDLYISGSQGFCYLALHDRVQGRRHPGQDYSKAYLGLYPLQDYNPPDPALRLLGAGALLTEVCAAANLLQQHWGQKAQVWSCPSYTRLAREAEQVRLRNQANSYLDQCLGAQDTPIVAVTGYARAVGMQLAPYLSAPFTALGADVLPPKYQLNRYWIAYYGLCALHRQGKVTMTVLRQALAHAVQGTTL